MATDDDDNNDDGDGDGDDDDDDSDDDDHDEPRSGERRRRGIRKREVRQKSSSPKLKGGENIHVRPGIFKVCGVCAYKILTGFQC